MESRSARFSDNHVQSCIAERLNVRIRCAPPNLLTFRKLLPPPGSTDADNFWTTLRERLDPLLAERERLLVPDMPVHLLADLCDELPYHLDLPRVGEKAVVTLPIYAVAAALDAGCRMADSMRKRKTDLTIAMVQARLDREIEKELRAFRGNR